MIGQEVKEFIAEMPDQECRKGDDPGAPECVGIEKIRKGRMEVAIPYERSGKSEPDKKVERSSSDVFLDDLSALKWDVDSERSPALFLPGVDLGIRGRVQREVQFMSHLVHKASDMRCCMCSQSVSTPVLLSKFQSL
jgi:hypothetical protein